MKKRCSKILINFINRCQKTFLLNCSTKDESILQELETGPYSLDGKSALKTPMPTSLRLGVNSSNWLLFVLRFYFPSLSLPRSIRRAITFLFSEVHFRLNCNQPANISRIYFFCFLLSSVVLFRSSCLLLLSFFQ